MRKSVSMGRIIAVIAAVLTVFSCVVTAFADTGPKPSVHVSFENLEEATCYATLLSSTSNYGPWSAWDGREENVGGDPTPEIWMAFAKYEDPDGYYFLRNIWEVGKDKGFAWTYWPPTDFKVLVYFPETGEFASTGALTRKAFDTFYIVKFEGHGIAGAEYDKENSSDKRMYAREIENYKYMFASAGVRLIVTIVIELVIALIFGLWRGKSLLIILAANVATQILLNVVLLLAEIFLMPIWTYILFIALEIGITALEAWFYCKTIPKVWVSWKNRALLAAGELSEKKVKSLNAPSNRRLIIYAIVANAASFAAGWIISFV
ncbi:MAG: hypothetical protein J6T65_05155 [Clostridia bacterium]|nr:hypothetical protein [Clostridia bacterium]MBP5664871.1 hypothetical protein [Clostridia bacterium]